MKSAPPAPETEEGSARQGRVAESTLSEAARRRLAGEGGAVFLGDWTGMVFLHYEVRPDRLQEVVPFPLDRREGKAFVSLVAFTMRRFRPALGGRATAWLTAPIATQPLLNLRTYVIGPHGPGIFFMREWLDHPFAVRLGPPTFGLPYRRGELSYQYHQDAVSGMVRTGDAKGAFSGRLACRMSVAPPGGLDEFLLERYTAYTTANFRPLAFRVWHEPWAFRDFEPEASTMDLFLRHLRQPWTASLSFERAVFSEGVSDVSMGRPRFAHP